MGGTHCFPLVLAASGILDSTLGVSFLESLRYNVPGLRFVTCTIVIGAMGTTGSVENVDELFDVFDSPYSCKRMIPVLILGRAI